MLSRLSLMSDMVEGKAVGQEDTRSEIEGELAVIEIWELPGIYTADSP